MLMNIVACKKEDSMTPTQPLSTSSTAHSTARVFNENFAENVTPVSQLVLNPEDAEDEAVNKVTLHLSAGLCEVMKTPTYATWIVQQANAQTDNEVLFTELFQQFPETQTIIENTPDPLGQLTGTPYAQLESQLQHTNITYKPSIFLANAGEVDATKLALVSPAIEVEDREGVAVDAYFAWRLQSTGVPVAVNVTEAMALNTTVPILSVGLRPGAVTVTSGTATAKTTGSGPTHGGYNMDFLQINHRYEGSGASEFCITAAAYSSSAGAWLNVLQDGPASTLYDWKNVMDVSKNDIGKKVYPSDANKKWFTNVGSNGSTAFYNTYERDWINTNKDLGSVTMSGHTLQLKGHRKYSDEWYGFDPSSLSNSNNSVDWNTLNLGYSTNTNNNSKGYLDMKYVP